MTEEVYELIGRARREGRSSLTEFESKKLLSFYCVPVVEEAVVETEDEAVARSGNMGFPVVLKGLGAKLTHKTERGLVRLNLKSEDEVRSAYGAIKKSSAEDWEGCLVQPLIEGKREFVAGLLQDAQFGAMIMLGLGGIFTEVIGDVTFRIAPLTEKHAQEMIDELAARKMLTAFRGEAAADRNQLMKVLMGLSRLGIEHPEIKEVDINPLIVMPDGCVKAVDALVVLDDNNVPGERVKPGEDETACKAAETRAALDEMMHAKSVAVIGATEARPGEFPGLYVCMRNFGYSGRLYPVNPNKEDIDGVKVYPDLASLPEHVDLVIISVPRTLVPKELKKCIASGNKNVHIFTSGFKETGEEEGVKLQQEIENIAREGGLRVVGPNCMGFYVPASRMLTWITASRVSGPVALISQSGGHAQDFTHYTTSRYDIHFSKVISYGNALTLDSTDYLDYLDHDDETRIITMYLEGVKDGRRLFTLAEKINRRKPIIMLKGGLTESGARAVSSHTGSMAGGLRVWNAFFRQSGVVSVDSVEQMADVTLAMHHLGTVPGRRMLVLGIGGGMGVAVADSCAKAGLDLPVLSPETNKKLRQFISPAGTMIRNPVDAYETFFNLDLLGKVMHVLATSGEIDNFVIWLHLDWLAIAKGGGSHLEEVARYLASEGRKHIQGKPLVVVWKQYEPNPEIIKWISVIEGVLLSAGIPVYGDFSRAAIALSKLAGYSAFMTSHSQPR